MEPYPIPKGLEISEEDMKRGTLEALSTFTINEDGTLSLQEIDGYPVDREPSAEEEQEQAPASREDVIKGFVQGQMGQQ